MGLFGKKKEVNSLETYHVYGIEFYDKNLFVTLNINDDILEIDPIKIKKPPVNLKYEQIVLVEVLMGKQLLIGNVSGDKLGILGETRNKDSFFLHIKYKNQNGETKELAFQMIGVSFKITKFSEELKKKIKTEEIPKEIYL
jgi:hypothetical protein